MSFQKCCSLALSDSASKPDSLTTHIAAALTRLPRKMELTNELVQAVKAKHERLSRMKLRGMTAQQQSVLERMNLY